MDDAPVEILLADADVLIDYRDSDLSILKLVSEHVGPVRVLREVLDEAPGISDHQCGQLGIEILQLETDLLLEANDATQLVGGRPLLHHRVRAESLDAGHQ